MKMSEGNRLHPLAALLSAIGSIRDFLLPLIILIITQLSRSSGSSVQMYWRLIPIVLVVLLSIIGGVWSWYVFRYGTADGKLFVYRGVLFKKRQYIPFERIQSVDLTEGILHRMFGLVKVQVQTAGGGKPEAVLSAVTKDEAARLQRELRSRAHLKSVEEEMDTEGEAANWDQAQPSASPGQSVPVTFEAENADTARSANRDEIAGFSGYVGEHNAPTKKLPFAKLFIAGLTSASLGLAFSLLLAFVTQVDELFPNLVPYQYFGSVGFWSILPFLLIFILLVAAALAIVLAILRFANFQITRQEDDLIIERGLLEKRKVTLPLKRIQAIRIVEEPAWQPFGLAAVHVESVGYGNEKGESTLMFPLLHRKEIGEFLKTFAPKFAPVEEFAFRKLPAKAWPGYVLPMPLFLAAGSTALTYWTNWGWVGWLLCGVYLLLGWWRYKSAGWQVEEDQLLLRFRSVTRSTVIIPRHRLQSFDVGRNPLQLRRGLSSIEAVVASGAAGAYFKLKGLLLEEATDILAWFRGWDNSDKSPAAAPPAELEYRAPEPHSVNDGGTGDRA